MKFGEKIQQLRLAAGMTQQQLADATGLSLGAIRNYEQGSRENPSLAVMRMFEKAFGVSCDVFADVEATETPRKPNTPKGKYK